MARDQVFNKQVSIYLPLAEWKMLQLESARTGKPMTQIIKDLMAPGWEKFKADFQSRESARADV